MVFELYLDSAPVEKGAPSRVIKMASDITLDACFEKLEELGHDVRNVRLIPAVTAESEVLNDKKNRRRYPIVYHKKAENNTAKGNGALSLGESCYRIMSTDDANELTFEEFVIARRVWVQQKNFNEMTAPLMIMGGVVLAALGVMLFLFPVFHLGLLGFSLAFIGCSLAAIGGVNSLKPNQWGWGALLTTVFCVTIGVALVFGAPGTIFGFLGSHLFYLLGAAVYTAGATRYLLKEPQERKAMSDNFKNDIKDFFVGGVYSEKASLSSRNQPPVHPSPLAVPRDRVEAQDAVTPELQNSGQVQPKV